MWHNRLKITIIQKLSRGQKQKCTRFRVSNRFLTRNLCITIQGSAFGRVIVPLQLPRPCPCAVSRNTRMEATHKMLMSETEEHTVPCPDINAKAVCGTTGCKITIIQKLFRGQKQKCTRFRVYNRFLTRNLCITIQGNAFGRVIVPLRLPSLCVRDHYKHKRPCPCAVSRNTRMETTHKMLMSQTEEHTVPCPDINAKAVCGATGSTSPSFESSPKVRNRSAHGSVFPTAS